MKTVPSSAPRRIAALLLAVLALITLASPTAAPVGTKTEEFPTPALLSGEPGLITESEIYRYTLGELLKCNTKTDKDGKIYAEVNIAKYGLTQSELSPVVSALLYSEAELFFIAGWARTQYEGSDVVQSILFYYEEGVDSSVASSRLTEFRALADEIEAKVDPTSGEWEKIAFIHDYIALHYDYDSSLSIFDAYTMLKEGIGVCQAYSLLTRYLLRQLGVGCECVSCNELNHEWNIVRIGVNWYHVDVTWDDRDDKGFYGQVSHEYFLSSDTHFNSGKHKSDSGWDSPVRATSGKYDDFFAGVTTPFIFTSDTIYAISDGALVTYDSQTERFTRLFDLGLQWHALGGVWQGTYAGLCCLKGNLYWNGENAVYSYVPGSNASHGTLVDRYLDLSGTIFGMRGEAGAEEEDKTIAFTLALMHNPNNGEVTEEIRVKGGYVITWQIGEETRKTFCLKYETPCFNGSPDLPSNLFDYTFLRWDKEPQQATKDATYVALFRMDRNDVILTQKTLREQYRLLRDASIKLPYANAGYAGASDREAELNDLLTVYSEEIAAANAAFSGVLFGAN